MKIAEMEEGHKAGDNVFRGNRDEDYHVKSLTFAQETPSSPFLGNSDSEMPLIETFTYQR